MSFGGILAQALAGGTKALGQQAGDDIEAGRRADLMKQQADIEEQMRMRLAEFSEKQRRSGMLWETSGEGGAAKLDLDRRTREQASDIAIKGKVSEATNPELVAAKAQEAEAELQREIRKIKETAKPEAEKAAAIAEARARAEAKYRKADPTFAGKMADMEKALGRPLTEQERLAAMGLAKGNPELDTVTIEETTGELGGPQTKTTRKEVRRPGQGGKADPADPYAVPKRDAAPAAKPAATDKPQGKGMLQSLTEAVSGAMDSGAQTGRAVEAVRAKVRAGQPLNAQEQAIAKQYNLTQG